MSDLHGYILPAAFIADLILGDPHCLPHPIRWMGHAISVMEAPFRKLTPSLFANGGLFAVSLILAAFLTTWLLIEAAQFVHPHLGSLFEIMLIYYAVSIRSLKCSAMAVSRALRRGDLSDARKKAGCIIGRDVQSLSADGVAAGAVESVAENLVDGVISPLFYAGIGGAPLAMAFKMVNTLDSMVGYKNEQYEQFGKFAARLDDLANYIPARLSILVVAVSARIGTGRGELAFKTAVLEGRNHTSPNAGYPEAAFAGALGVRLNGPNIYGGILVEKPFIGIRFNRPEEFHIKRACDLMMLSATIWFLTVWSLNLLLPLL